MLPELFIQDWIKLFFIETVIFCTDNFSDESILTFMEMMPSISGSVAFSNIDEISIILDGVNREEKCLIICSNIPPDENIPDEVIHSNLFWMFPKSRSQDVRKKALRLDGNVYLLETDRNDYFIIEEVYKVKLGNPVQNFIGFWNQTGGLQIKEPNWCLRRSNLGGITLKNVVIEYEPLLSLDWNSGNQFRPRGYFVDIYEILESRLNFKTKHILSPDGQWGAPISGSLSNPVWNGIVGMLQKEQIDISIAGVTYSSARKDVISFTMALVEDKSTIVMRADANKASVNLLIAWAFVDAFTKELWSSLFTLIFLIIMLFYLANHGRREFLSSIGIILCIMGGRDASLESKHRSGKIILFVTCMFSFVIYAAYTALLTSFMTLRPQPPPIKTFQDLLDKDIQLFIWESTQAAEYLQKAEEGSALNKLFMKMKSSKNYTFETTEEGARDT